MERIHADRRYQVDGGWKVHLTIGPDSYERRMTAVKRWLRKTFQGSWKHLDGGDQHEKNFTIYLGSYATMMSFVNRLEADPIIRQLDASKAGSADRLVGNTGKSARALIRGAKGLVRIGFTVGMVSHFRLTTSASY
jgi:hypothetical protein